MILGPGFTRLREWAYVGFTFDVAGAMYSGIAVGNPVGNPVSAWLPLIVSFALITAFYSLNHKIATARQPTTRSALEAQPA